MREAGLTVARMAKFVPGRLSEYMTMGIGEVQND